MIHYFHVAKLCIISTSHWPGQLTCAHARVHFTLFNEASTHPFGHLWAYLRYICNNIDLHRTNLPILRKDKWVLPQPPPNQLPWLSDCPNGFISCQKACICKKMCKNKLGRAENRTIPSIDWFTGYCSMTWSWLIGLIMISWSWLQSMSSSQCWHLA
jgi:hypothetical protein